MDLTFSLIDDLMNNDRELDEFYQDVSREEIDKNRGKGDSQQKHGNNRRGHKRWGHCRVYGH